MGPLHQQAADAAGGGVDQGGFATLEAVDLVEQEPGRDALEGHGGGGLRVDALRERDHQNEKSFFRRSWKQQIGTNCRS